MEPNGTSPKDTFDEKIKLDKNRRLNNLIKKSLLLISTLAGVAIGTLIGAYQFQLKLHC